MAGKQTLAGYMCGLRYIVTVLACAGALALSACGGNDTAEPPKPTDAATVNGTGVATAKPLPSETAKADDGRIHKNLRIGGIDVGGLTEAEAKALLATELQKAFDDSRVSFLLDTKRGETPAEFSARPFTDFGITLDIDGTVRRALDFTRTAPDAEKNRAALEAAPVDLETGCYYDTAALSGTLAAMEAEITLPAEEPKVQRENGAFVVSAGHPGIALDIGGTLDAFTDALKTYHGTRGVMPVTLAVTETQPQFSSGDAMQTMDLLGSWTTKYDRSATNRNENVRLAAMSVHNTFLLPGELFSTNATFGPTTPERGYKPGGTYVNGKLVDSIGGGVCQTSSTLYRALLEAELEIVERTNHSLPVGYMALGFDATLAGDYIDMKFRNNTDAPVLLEALMADGSLTINVYGRETRPSTRTVEYKSELVSTIQPPEEKVTEDPTLPMGERVVDAEAKTGYHYKTYKHVYENGVFQEKIYVADSRYRTMAAEVRIGTMPVGGSETGATEPPATETPGAVNPDIPVAEAPTEPTPAPAEPQEPEITTPALPADEDEGPLMP